MSSRSFFLLPPLLVTEMFEKVSTAGALSGHVGVYFNVRVEASTSSSTLLSSSPLIVGIHNPQSTQLSLYYLESAVSILLVFILVSSSRLVDLF